MLVLRHLAWCHVDDGTILTMHDTGPDAAIMSLWCATCDALEAQIAVWLPGGVRFPPCPHEDEGPWDIWYAEGIVNIACHVCQNLCVYLAVATRDDEDDDSQQVLAYLRTATPDKESYNDTD
jgi:hypothetical protein